MPTSEGWLDRLGSQSLAADGPGPRLLFGAEELQPVAAKVRSAEPRSPLADWSRQVRERAAIVAAEDPAHLTEGTEPFYALPALDAVFTAFLITGEEQMAVAVERIVDHFLDHDNWIAHVHGEMSYDHAAANTASAVARALDAIAPTLSASSRDLYNRRLVERGVAPFVAACRKRELSWTRRDTESNWRIMTCGEAGLAALGSREQNPQASEALYFAAEGVLDSFDRVAPEGDWPEGLNYWLITLGFGLRFAEALRRSTEGGIDLFEHPALARTGDYIVQLIKQDGSGFNFNDNHPEISEEGAGSIYLLAHRLRRRDWAWVAARTDRQSVQRLLVEDELSELRPPTSTSAFFPRTGVAVFRDSWKRDGTFVGFKCGPSNVGHSHLDANSFVFSVCGTEVLGDNGYWPQDHFNGFFEAGERRWNFDANGTVGHNTILVDGEGQRYGAERAGRILRFETGGGYGWVIGDASPAYPGLNRFRRWLVFVHDDAVILFDEVEADGPRRLEWLLHYRGEITGELGRQTIRNGEVTATATWLHPEDQLLWRVSDVARTTYYRNADSGEDVSRQIRYRSFGPIHRRDRMEALLLIAGGEKDDWRADEAVVEPSSVRITLEGLSERVIVVMNREAATCDVERSRK